MTFFPLQFIEFTKRFKGNFSLGQFLFFASFFCVEYSFAQTATLTGRVVDAADNAVLPAVTVQVLGKDLAVIAANDGTYSLKLPSETEVVVQFSYVGYKKQAKTLRLGANEKRRLNIALAIDGSMDTVVIHTVRQTEVGRQSVNVEAIKILPLPSMNVESALATFGLGARAGKGGELSAQYSVRGGNYDENLVYVNGFEIYRPVLIRNGQQEGLTFPNIDLIRSMSFSSGGFEALYGDKMSSVLDIEYKNPTKTMGSISGSLLGASGYVEGSTFKKGDTTGIQRFRYMLGIRYKSNSYLLNALPATGEYTPTFGDIQSYISYDLTPRLKIDWIANYNTSRFLFKPDEVKETFGTVNETKVFRAQYEGQEVSDFTTYMTGVSLTHTNPKKHYFLKYFASGYISRENERYDIEGAYNIGVLATSGDNAGQTVAAIGDGIEHRFGRNYLTSRVVNIEHRGGWEYGKPQPRNANDSLFTLRKRYENSHYLQWGAKAQQEQISDKLNEWYRIDSSGYSLNWDTTQLNLKTYLKTNINLQSMRYSGFLQDTWTYSNDIGELKANVGLRATFWNYTNELVLSPRAQFTYKPLTWKRDITFKLAGGIYAQPAFYRELRDLNGTLHPEIRAQKSAHLVAGMVYDFKMFNRPFKFITEAYYKKLWDLVPYEQENVKIRYYGTNNATGYATGIDMRLNGEFVEGAESWINLSFLRTREALDGVQHRTVYKDEATGVFYDTPTADVPRPTDGLFALSMFFQDYFPKNKNFKMHLNLAVADGVPFAKPIDNIIYRNPFRYQIYHREDIGFSYLLWDNTRKTRSHALQSVRSAWASLEVLNLMDVRNESSVSWIRTIFNEQYPIKNRLTGRLINLRFKVDF